MMKLKYLAILPIFIFSPYVISKEPPKKFSFQINQVYDATYNKAEYDRQVKVAKNYQKVYSENESLGDVLGLICKKGLSRVEQVSPMIFGESVDYKSEAEMQYFPITNFNPSKYSDRSFPEYNVECGFKTKKSDSLPRSVKVVYKELVRITKYDVTYENKISLR